MRLPTLISILALLLLCACPKQDGTDPASQPSGATAAVPASSGKLKILCDPLLLSLLTELEPQFRGEHKGYEVQGMERGVLLKHIGSGDRFEDVDVFAYADPQLGQSLMEAGLISVATLRTFAGDQLALISREGESWRADTLFDIYSLRFKKLCIGSTDSVSGFFAERALISDGVMPRVEDRLSRPDTAAAIVEELLSGQAEMAIVPRSMLLDQEGVKVLLLIDRSLHKDFQYRIAGAVGSEENPQVMALLTMLAEDAEVQGLISGYGFDNRSEAMGLNTAAQ
jgi:molybdenum ABC transporter molybdate-binding protein